MSVVMSVVVFSFDGGQVGGGEEVCFEQLGSLFSESLVLCDRLLLFFTFIDVL